MYDITKKGSIMQHHATLIDEHNNTYHFRVNSCSVYIYAECYESAIKKLKTLYGNDTIID